MTKLIATIMTVSVVTLLAGPARATTISTPIIPLRTDAGVPFCYVLNGGKSPVEVTIAVVDEDGNVETSVVAVIPPDNIYGTHFGVSSVQADRAMCRIEGKFSRKAVKATFHSSNTSAWVTTP
jgi:hypothetical protein